MAADCACQRNEVKAHLRTLPVHAVGDIGFAREGVEYNALSPQPCTRMKGQSQAAGGVCQFIGYDAFCSMLRHQPADAFWKAA